MIQGSPNALKGTAKLMRLAAGILRKTPQAGTVIRLEIVQKVAILMGHVLTGGPAEALERTLKWADENQIHLSEFDNERMYDFWDSFADDLDGACV